jgi:ATP-dependent helicase/nuclease subunit B
MLKIALATVGAGKTEHALHTITTTLQEKPFARVWVLLATQRQQDTLRQRLIEHSTEHNLYFNVEFFDFYKLYRRLLNMAHQPARGLADSARFGLLRRVIRALRDSGQLPLYAAISETPGFVRIVAAFIYELKQNRVEPETYRRAAETLQRKDRELALIYSEYQRILQDYHLVDKEGEGWLALARLVALESLTRDVDLLVVDGFDQFTRVQAALLQVLSERVGQTLVTLTTVARREDTIGRRFSRALETLRWHKEGVFPAQIERLMGASERNPDLQHLVETIFLPGAKKRASTGGVQLIEAPDAGSEIAAVLRQVKRLLLNGCDPEDIIIALRDWTRYQPHLLALSREYRIPLALHYGERLADNPAINTVMKLLTLHETGFRRREVLDVLRSPYVRVDGLDDAGIGLLEKVSQRYSVTGGWKLWRDALARAAQPLKDEEGEVQEALADSETLEKVAWSLEEFFDSITPQAGEATAEYYVDRIENLLGSDPMESAEEENPYIPYSLHIIQAVRAADDETLARDLLALQEFKTILRGLLATQTLLTNLDRDYDPRMKWEMFFAELKTAVDSAEVNPQPNRGGRVLVTSASNARGLPHLHVFVPGLSEGIFPMPVPEDPLYLDSERRRLTHMGVELATAAERATDDGLFYELISLPRESLTLSRPTAQDGQPWTESHLWRATRSVFEDLKPNSIRAGEVVKPEDAASLNELALAVADTLSRNEPAAGLYNWLLYHERDYWTRIAASQAAESRRFSSEPHDRYSGRLEHLVEHAVSAVGDGRIWSATQFNEYGVCPFRFFAKRLLKLEELKPPEEGMDILQTGSLNHAILEKTYRFIQGEKLTISPRNKDIALEILHTVAQEVFPTAPDTYGFRPTALWRQEQQTLLRRLEHLVSLDFSPLSPIPGEDRFPYLLEAPFGRDGGVPVSIGLEDGTALRVNGYIDRIDRVGDSLVVIDYKTGSIPFKEQEMSAGRNFQMIVYLLAAEAMIWADTSPDAPQEVMGGLFWHIRTGEISGKLLAENRYEVTESAFGHLNRYVEYMRRGDFAVQPGNASEGKCVKYCEYQHLCRLCGLNLRKA